MVGTTEAMEVRAVATSHRVPCLDIIRAPCSPAETRYSPNEGEQAARTIYTASNAESSTMVERVSLKIKATWDKKGTNTVLAARFGQMMLNIGKWW